MQVKSSKKKLTLIGAGNIGGTIASIACATQTMQVVLFDVNKGVAEGKALDISQSSAIAGYDANIIGTNKPEDIANSDAVIITAGVPRKQGMTRADVLNVNTKVITEAAQNVGKYNPNAFVVIVTNPLDAMTHLFQKVSGLPKTHVVGMAGELDLGRFKHFLAKELDVAVKDISSLILGCHGDTMVPLLNSTTVCGKPLIELIANGTITTQKVEEIVKRTKGGGAEIISLLGNGSAYYAPARAALDLAEAYLFDNQRCFCVSTFLPSNTFLPSTIQIEPNNICVGLPAIINGNGVRKVLEDFITTRQHIKQNNIKSTDSSEIQSPIMESMASEYSQFLLSVAEVAGMISDLNNIKNI